MLRIALAGLVLQKVLSLEEAEYIDKKLSLSTVPSTVKEIIEEIKKTKRKFKK